jgi:mannose-6-phosphate isomerase-like protein (cupin superfamily)
MFGFKENIEELVRENSNFRKVIYTAKHSQLVLMSLRAKEEIGSEVHESSDQFFRFEHGTGKVLIDGTEYLVTNGDAVLVPAGAKHNVINLSDSQPLQMYTVYSPPHHRDKVVHVTKEEAERDSEKFEGITTE